MNEALGIATRTFAEGHLVHHHALVLVLVPFLLLLFLLLIALHL